MYCCEFTDVRKFILHLRIHCIARGYHFYVTGTIPAHKDPRKTDEKIIGTYDIDMSKWVRCRQRKTGRAAVHYLRCGHCFVILATAGVHRFFNEEGNVLRDVRRTPLTLMGCRIHCQRHGQKRKVSVAP